MTLSTVATGPDLLRLLSIPVFAWVAVRDVRTRRISSDVWIPLATLGAILLLWEGWLAWRAGSSTFGHDFLLPAAVSLGIVVPIAYLFWWIGGFGGADAKALFTLAILFPTVPRYAVAGLELPIAPPPIGAFSLSILTNAVLAGIAIPIALAIRNAAAGRFALTMFIGHPVRWERVARTHGVLLETTDGRSTGGLDLDALRMYLRWRGLTLAELRESPDVYRDPTTLPAEPNPPTDGAIDAGFDVGDGSRDGGGIDDADRVEETTGERAVETAADGELVERDGGGTDAPEAVEDPWGAAAFLEDIDGTAYGTTPETLRDGLEVLAEEDVVWISPGTPFLVPVFLGLLLAVFYGDLLTALLF